jgi:putative ABC transport system permease protein
MLKSYLVIAFKHLTTQKLYSAINIVGLAVGLACFILIAIFVRHELSYDEHFTNADRIHRVSRDFFGERAAATSLATIAAPAAPLLEQDFPEIERAARLSVVPGGIALTGPDGEARYQEGVGEADNALFEIFDFEWLGGDPATALIEPFTLVLTESVARSYFGNENPLGRTLVAEDQTPLEVTGVIADLGNDTHFRFSVLSSLATTEARNPAALANWNFNRWNTYVLLEEGADAAAIESQSGEFFERRFAQGSSEYTGFSTTALTDIHLRSNREQEMRPPGRIVTVYTFSAIAAFVLLIACINFVNLATARSSQRAKEIGVRKAAGASQGQVVAQFLAESVLLAFVAVLLAVTLVELMLPPFNASLGQTLEFEYLSDPRVAGALLALAVVIGVAAGAYPAFYLSAFDLARVLKGDVTRGRGAAVFRKALVVVQFSISIALLIGTAVVFQQMQFARNIEFGYETGQIVVVQGSRTRGLGERWETLKREWLANPEITHVTASNLTPGTQNSNALGMRAEGGDPDGRGVPFLWVDYGFFETYDIGIVAGRTFSSEFGTDRLAAGPDEDGTAGAYVINELAAREFGWTAEEAIGKWLELGPGQNRGPVVGVVENVYFESVHNAIAPTVYMIPPDADIGYVPLPLASLRVSGRNLESTLAYIDEKWSELAPGQPMSRRFLDQDFAALYEGERRQSRMFTAFSALAILIACLGLLGLASFATEQRTKEIGVRKVVGGTVLDIVQLFTGDFSKLVLLANVIAWPAAYFLMQRWLENFAYRIEMSFAVFAGSAVFALVVALVTVGAIAARAASLNPVHSLRYE